MKELTARLFFSLLFLVATDTFAFLLLPHSNSRKEMTLLYQENLWDDDSTQSNILTPNPDMDSMQVVKLCMDALQSQKPDQSLELCFNFSSDRCRAAVGGSLEEFMQYAANPVFGKLVLCGDYEIVSVGPIIPGSQVRGDMQTFLIEISKGLTVNDVMKNAQKRPSIEERIRQSEAEARGEVYEEQNRESPPSGGRFIWTMQKERRPPRQNCWLVHEVLFERYAFSQTE